MNEGAGHRYVRAEWQRYKRAVDTHLGGCFTPAVLLVPHSRFTLAISPLGSSSSSDEIRVA